MTVNCDKRPKNDTFLFTYLLQHQPLHFLIGHFEDLQRECCERIGRPARAGGNVINEALFQIGYGGWILGQLVDTSGEMFY